jgi:SAM-dependent methyltransferase
MAPKPKILDPSTNNPFAHPSGWLGRMAGRFMLWTNKQDEVVDVLAVQPGHDVLEIGYGPGGLIRLLAERTDAASIRGVDPSPEMRDQASRHNRKAVRTGRVALDLGTADRTGLPDASLDRVVSVNNVAIWPDVEAAVDERTGSYGRAASSSSLGMAARRRPGSPGRCACPRASSAASSTCCEIVLARSPASSWPASTYSRPFARGESGTTRLVTV